MRGTSLGHVGGGENPHLTEPLVCEYDQTPRSSDKGFDWPDPTPESDAFWADVSAGLVDEGKDTFNRPGRNPSFDHGEAMRRYKDGEPAGSIAADMGCSAAAIYNLASKHGIKRSKTPAGAKQGAASQGRSSAATPVRSGPVNGSHRVPPTAQERSPARQQEMRPGGAGDRPGKNPAETLGGNDPGSTYEDVVDADADEVERSQTADPPSRGKLAPHADEVVRRYQAGESSTAIATAFGVRPGAVTNLLHSRGVKVRDRRQAHREHYGLPVDTPPAQRGEKVCNRCHQSKPLSEFPPHKNTVDGKAGACRTCSNKRPPSETRAIRNRARNRAYAELAARHEDEWKQLLEAKTVEVTAEFDRLRQAAGPNGDPVPRLKPGPKRREQTDVTERLDVARCRTCHTHHDAGHVCPTCGDDTPENQPLVPPYVIRAWARAQGMGPVPPNGPLPNRLVNAYLAAQGEEANAS